MGVDNENSTPASSADGNQEHSYLDDFTQGASGDSPTPAGEQAPDSPSGEAGDENSPDGQQPEGSLDIVKRAIEANTEGDGDSPRSDTAGQEQDKSKSGDEAEGEKDKAEAGEQEDDADLPFHKHPRWQQMKQQRDDLKARAETAEQRLEELGDVDAVKEHASRYQEINNFLTQSGLNGDDFANGLHIMNLMKNDPEKALEAIEPYYSALQRMTGNTLPDDLKQMLDDGTIDENTAYKFARERAQSQRLQHQNRQLSQVEQQREQERQRQEAEQRRQASLKPLYEAADQWEQEWQKSDPDYEKLAPMVRLRVQELMAQTQVKQPDDVVKVCKKARDDVRSYLKKVVPGKQPQEPLPDGAGSGGQPPQPAPKTSLEAARQAVRQ